MLTHLHMLSPPYPNDTKEETTERIDPGRCGREQWRCNNGECINAEFVCDNNSDCFDESDEDDELCRDYGNDIVDPKEPTHRKYKHDI